MDEAASSHPLKTSVTIVLILTSTENLALRKFAKSRDLLHYRSCPHDCGEQTLYGISATYLHTHTYKESAMHTSTQTHAHEQKHTARH